MKRLCIVCPCYFDAPSFRLLREEALTALKDSANYEISFMVVDDTAGRDPALLELQKLSDVQVLKAPFNLGHQKALVYGLRSLVNSANPPDLVVTMDSDGEDQPADLPKLLSTLETNPNELVLAKRTQRSESLKFRVFYKFYKLLFAILTGRTVQSGNFAAFSLNSLRSFIGHPHFDSCYSMSLFSAKIPVRFVPLARGKRFKGESKMNTLSLVRHGLNMLMPFLDQIAFRGILMFVGIAFLGIFLGLAVLYIKLFTPLAIPGWTSYLVLGLVTLSVTAFGNLLVLFFMYTQMDSHLLMDLVNSAPDGQAKK